VGTGSFESAKEILAAKLQPTMWSPSDSMALKLLQADWQAEHHTELFATTADDDTQPLVLPPLVFIVWEDRANVLKKSGRGDITWKAIRQGITSAEGWPALGGQAHWGALKPGHTDPTQSNSGLQALYLMLLEHTGKARLGSKDLLGAKTVDFVRGIEKGVAKLGSSGSSTGHVMTDMVRFGPSKFDLALVYESTAIAELAHAEGRWGKLTICYPTKTIWSDNPAAVLGAPWVSEAQKRAAKQYLAFLRSRPAQERALAHGVRPADTSITMITKDAQNPFVRLADHGLVVDVPAAVDVPEIAVARGLMSMWKRMM
jgi:hypothetical protein